MSDEPLTIDDIVTGRVAEELRYILSHRAKPWQILGPLRSTTLKLEADDLACWQAALVLDEYPGDDLAHIIDTWGRTDLADADRAVDVFLTRRPPQTDG